ncbi:hypothetical protein Pfo_025919 [Paulownia fortunei]|nr:hypothetical protein Pfo_025919 [Paulownia fortunei]
MDSISLTSPPFALNDKSCWWALDDECKYRYSSSSFSCLLPSFSEKLRLRGNSAIVAAEIKKKDGHSFIPRADEATGPFPEAVLLKELDFAEVLIVSTDGRVMPELADIEELELVEALNLKELRAGSQMD